MTQSADKRSLRILLVEDDAGDRLLAERAFDQAGVPCDLQCADDGAAALRYLDVGFAGQGPCPDLVLLDLNLARMDGKDVLAAIRANPRMRTLPVIVLSTSDNPRDVARLYELGANAYLTKPFDNDRLLDMVRAIDVFWNGAVTLPPRG